MKTKIVQRPFVSLLFVTLALGCNQRALDSAQNLKARQSALGPSGAVHATVAAQLQPGADVPLPDIRTFMVNINTGDVTPPASTDITGFVEFANLPAAPYNFCWGGGGYTPSCSPPITVADKIAVPNHFNPFPQSRAVQGHVALADGSRAYFRSDLFNVEATVQVTLMDTIGNVVGGPVRANADGDYVVTTSASGDFLVRAILAGATTANTAPFFVGETFTHAPDLLLPDRPPQVSTTFAYLNGVGTRRATPNQDVEARVAATDPDGDTLHYFWSPGVTGGSCGGADASSVTCTLGPSKEIQLIYTLVSDGKGAYALGTAHVLTDDAGELFTGTVAGSDVPIVAGADVSVNGISTATDGNGYFSLLVPPTNRYVLNIKKTGYQLLSRIYFDKAVGQKYWLQAVPRQTVDPSGDISVDSRDRQPATLFIPRNSLVDSSGQPPIGLVDIYFSTIDRRNSDQRMPGDFGGLALDGNEVLLTSYGATQVDVVDALGTKYNLVAGATANINLSLYPEQVALAPPVNRMWYYNEDSGLWVEDANPAILSGGRYQLTLPHFSVINVDAVFSNADCIKVDVDTEKLPLGFNLKITVQGSAGVPEGHSTSIASTPSVIARLPAHRDVTIEVLYDNVVVPGATQTVTTGNPSSSSNKPDPPYDVCNTKVLLTNNVTTHEPTNGFLNFHFVSSEAEAVAYYNKIDPPDGSGNSTRDTLDKWKAANGFGADDASAIYFNAGDLGFGRSMHMKQVGGNVAYYVSNYDTVDAAVFTPNSPIATVAMEYSAFPLPDGNPRFTKFYVFGGNGNRVTGAALDRRNNNDIKFVPKLCNVCHGGTQAIDPHGNTQARFIGFDLLSFHYSDALGGVFHRASQEDEPHFKGLNRAILSTNASDAITTLVNGWYGGPGLPAGTQNDAFVPIPGWMGHGALYLDVVRHSCRSCHSTRDDGLDWNEYFSFHSRAGNIVCGTRDMPNAPVTWYNFWFSTSPYQPALLQSDVGLSACDP
jgi:hypothetical protein